MHTDMQTHRQTETGWQINREIAKQKFKILSRARRRIKLAENVEFIQTGQCDNDEVDQNENNTNSFGKSPMVKREGNKEESHRGQQRQWRVQEARAPNFQMVFRKGNGVQ